MKKILTFFYTLISLSIATLTAQNSILTYAGSDSSDCFYDVVQLSDKTFLVAGYTYDLAWLGSATKIELGNATSIPNSLGTNRYALIIQFSEDFQTILNVVHLPKGKAEDIMFIKTTNIPGQNTGEMYISGTTEDSKTNKGGYFIGKLNNNFVNGVPTGFTWVKPIWADAAAYFKARHAWDVTNNGKVYFFSGETHLFGWSEMGRLKADGSDDVVPKWTMHIKLVGGEYIGVGSDFPGGLDSLTRSIVLFKKEKSRCCLRSWTVEDYELMQPDGNGGTRKGKWPLDQFFMGPCERGVTINYGRGYGNTWYRVAGSSSSTETYGPSVITVDRRNNALYFGFNVKTVLPVSNLPDFEPAVVAMDSNGLMQWWSRLYHEIRPDGDTMVSEPDQYVDGLAIDYSKPVNDGRLIVNARCHGNNVENLWEGNSISANPTATGFLNRFIGSNGNIHIGWLGKFKTVDGTILNSTYVAEYNEGTGSLGTPFSDVNMDKWPNPNSGWADLNTTRVRANSVKVATDGSVIITSSGRRTITTKNAHQRMVLPSNGGLSCWNQFVREYTSDLSRVTYSTLLVGAWDTLTQAGGGNTEVYNIFRTDIGIVAVGKQTATAGVPNGNNIPVSNVPTWGSSTPKKESAILAYFKADSLNVPVAIDYYDEVNSPIIIYPNPSKGLSYIYLTEDDEASVSVYDARGVFEQTSIIKHGINQIQFVTKGLKVIVVKTPFYSYKKVIIVQ